MHYRAGKDWFKQTLLPSGVGRYTVGNSSKIEKTERNEQNEKRAFQTCAARAKGEKAQQPAYGYHSDNFICRCACYALHNGQHYKNECGIQAEHLRRMVRRNTVRN